jgi:TrkA domain protein
VNTQQIVLSHESPYVNRTLGDTHLRTRTGASIVALSRSGRVFPSPGPDFELNAGDVLIIVGTSAGLENAAHLINDG